MLELLQQTLGPWGSLFFLVVTGGLGGAIAEIIKYLRTKAKSNQTAQATFREDLRCEVESLRTQVDDLRERFVNERRARLDAQFVAFSLRKKLNLVIEMLNEARDELGLSEMAREDIPGDVPTEAELKRSMNDLNATVDDPDKGPRTKTKAG